MSCTLSLHDCTRISIKQHIPANDICVTLLVVGGDGEIEINLDGLSRERVSALLAAIGKPDHVDPTPPLDLLSQAATANLLDAIERMTMPRLASLGEVTQATAAATK